MVHVYGQDIPPLACAQHLHSQQRCFVQIERRDELLQPLLYFFLRCFRISHLDMRICLNPLHQLTVHQVKRGAQAFMTLRQLGKCLPQPLQIQLALYVQHRGDVVANALGIQLTHYKYPFLSG
ncbi:hypothetical protein D3C78_1389440 [compost metagenome]